MRNKTRRRIRVDLRDDIWLSGHHVAFNLNITHFHKILNIPFVLNLKKCISPVPGCKPEYSYGS